MHSIALYISLYILRKNPEFKIGEKINETDQMICSAQWRPDVSGYNELRHISKNQGQGQGRVPFTDPQVQ